ncbi:MAG: 4-hydroxy-3-methylbut-2-enyl diphosphate reductase [Treponema sp.]|nr:4-hydroxy-3-methylbut-2-enyl diphosphate reductase [Treponema sp.]
MEIIRAHILGFCSGVRRAVKSADSVLGGHSGKTGNVYSLGPLIHNPLVLDGFEKRGLKVLSQSDIDVLGAGDTVLIRAHGVSPELEEKIRDRGADVVNATCPLVTHSQKRVADFASDGFTIIFAGDRNHGEVIGIEGYARAAAAEKNLPHSFFLVKDEVELRALFDSGKVGASEKIVLLCQTTFSIPIFEKIVSALAEKAPSAQIVNSICPATHERQDALEKMCGEVDAVVVIGGKNSANTNRLLKAASQRCSYAVLVESAEEFSAGMVEKLCTFKKIGLTAGASTPDDVIDDVERFLQTI